MSTSARSDGSSGWGILRVVPCVRVRAPTSRPPLRLGEAEIGIGHVVADAHLRFRRGAGAVRVVVRERVGQGDVVPVPVAVTRRALPVAVRRLVVAHQEEGARGVAGLQPVDAHVGDDVGDIALHLALAVGEGEEGVEILALPRQHGPVVEAGRLVARPLPQVPLAEDRRLVAAGPQVLGDVRQAVVDVRVERRDGVDVVVGAGEDRRARGRADRVRDVAMLEPHAALGQPVDMGRVVDSCAIGRDGLRGVVVGHDEDDVGPIWHGSGPRLSRWACGLDVRSFSEARLPPPSRRRRGAGRRSVRRRCRTGSPRGGRSARGRAGRGWTRRAPHRCRRP